ncbi:MAG: glycosyltransferase [Victivallaceae bacterium]|nr:glycosyltransferase [Victivallaceae bacterium]
MSIPAVSICCITYNHEKYIRDALEGFLMQKTDFPFEILIHDDASTDGTADIIREYEAKYPDIIKPIYQTENQYSQGKFIWCEFQFPCAKGKYIALCEGDDFWTDQRKLQIQYDFMESHPDYSMCFHNAKVIDENGCENHLFDHIESRDYAGMDLLKKWTVPTASSFFRTKYISKIPAKNDFWCGDIIVWLTMSQCGKIRALPEKMSVYRQLNSGATAQFYCKQDAAWLDRQIRHYTALGKTFPFIPRKIIRDFLLRARYENLLFLHRSDGWTAVARIFLRYPLPVQMKLFGSSIIHMIYIYRKKRKHFAA